MSALAASLLAQTIDDHMAWMTAWSRVAFYEAAASAVPADPLPVPESFTVWRHEAAISLQDAAALERLAACHDQLHRAARLAILKAASGAVLPREDYDAVAARFHELMTGLRRLEKALAAASSGIDALTGLRSRNGMMEDLAREFSRFLRSEQPFCLAMMDIDHFKKINDAYGHEAGDKVLSAVANFVSRSLRPFDDIWRWGGEEFLMCLKSADLLGGSIAVERVRAGLEIMPIKLTAGRVVSVTASFGIVAAARDAGIDRLIAEADRALYRAKTGGRNRIEAGAVMEA